MSSNQHEIDEAFLREARIGLMVLTVLVAVFIYVAFGKLSGWHQAEPAAFQNQEQNQEKSQADANKQSPALLTSQNPLDGSNPARPILPGPAGKQDGSLLSQRESQVSANPIEQTLTELPGEPVAHQLQPKSPQRPLPTVNLPFDPDTSQLSEFIPSSVKTDSGERPGRTLGRPTSTTRDDRFQMSENRFRADDATKPPVIPAGHRSPDEKFQPKIKIGPPTRDRDGDRTARSVETGRASVQPTSAVESIGQKNLPDRNDVQPIKSNASDMPFSNEPSPVAKDRDDTVPLPPKKSAVIAEQGDSFWLIAQQAYGDGRYFDALYQFNKDRVDSFNEVPEGTELLIPPALELRQRWPRLCPREQIETLGGETLFQIAGDKLGQASRYVELLKINYSRLPQDVDQNTRLPAGIMLELPRQK